MRQKLKLTNEVISIRKKLKRLGREKKTVEIEIYVIFLLREARGGRC